MLLQRTLVEIKAVYGLDLPKLNISLLSYNKAFDTQWNAEIKKIFMSCFYNAAHSTFYNQTVSLQPLGQHWIWQHLYYGCKHLANIYHSSKRLSINFTIEPGILSAILLRQQTLTVIVLMKAKVLSVISPWQNTIY